MIPVYSLPIILPAVQGALYDPLPLKIDDPLRGGRLQHLLCDIWPDYSC